MYVVQHEALYGRQSQTTVFPSPRHSRTRRVCHHRASGGPFSYPNGATVNAQGCFTPCSEDRVRGSGSRCWPLELGLGTREFTLRLCKARTPLILLDTNALLWLQGRHKRSRPLSRWAGRLYISPASLPDVSLARIYAFSSLPTTLLRPLRTLHSSKAPLVPSRSIRSLSPLD